MRQQSQSATLIGYIGVLFWSFSALFNAAVRSIPVFEIITVAYGLAAIIIFAKVAIKHEWHKFRQPLAVYIIGLLGIFGNDIFYIAAFKKIPAVQADLINYLWPVCIVFFAGFLPKEKFNVYHFVAAIIAIIGTYLLFTKGQGLGGFNSHYIIGYILALCGVVVWCVYVLVSRNYQNIPIEMVAMYCGIGALISLIIHLSIEPTIEPSMPQWIVLILIGCTAQGLAYVFWDYGVKRGNLFLLSILTYGNPIISVVLLVTFGYANLSDVVAVASVFITIAGLMATFDKHLHKFLCRLSFVT